MGVYVHLHVLEGAIPQTAWAEIYDDTRRLLRAHPSGLLGLKQRTLLGHEVLVYTRDIERMTWKDREICVVGDRRSLRFGESFHMPYRLGSDESHRDEGEDIVYREPDEPRGEAIFSDKTQGEPYHTAILAAAMVVETRFPGAALVWGDIDEDDASEAKRWAEPLLGRELALPVLLDAPALVRRLSAKWQGRALIEAFDRRYEGRRQDGFAPVLTFVDRGTAETWVRKKLCRKPRSSADALLSERVIWSWLTATGDLPRLCELACVHPRGPRVSPDKLVAALASTGALMPAALQQRAERCRNTTRSLRRYALTSRALLAAVYIERSVVGRGIAPGELEASLTRIFPERAAELLAHARAESRKHDESLASMCSFIEVAEPFLEGIEPFQDVGELAALRSAEELSTARRKELAVLAYGLRGLFRDNRPLAPGPRAAGEKLFKACLAGKDVKAARLHFVRAASTGHRLTLPEDAWEWILREDDPRLVGFLVRLFSSAPWSEEGTQLKRAVLSSRVLVETVASMMEDDALMKNVCKTSPPGIDCLP